MSRLDATRVRSGWYWPLATWALSSCTRAARATSSGRPAAWLRILLGLVVIFLPGALSLLLGQIDGVVGGSLAALFRGISLLLHLAVYAYGTGALLGSRFGAEAARARRRATVA